jgi:type IX secretion system PorP/SprF family membrane protein
MAGRPRRVSCSSSDKFSIGLAGLRYGPARPHPKLNKNPDSMKNSLTLLIFLLIAALAHGQQDEHYTQFMHYKLGYNPAYAGSTGGTRITVMGRNQWLGLDGAPQTQLITFNMAALQSRMLGVGASVVRQTIGISDRYTLEGNYAYRFRMGNGHLGLGLSASVRMIRIDFNRARATQPIETDAAIPGSFQSRFVPNFGFGVYYNTENFYFGFSAPRLLANSIDLSDDGGTLTKEVSHFYGMTGFIIPLGDNVKMQPHILLKYVQGAPFDTDVNTNITFMDKFTVGASYRVGGSKTSPIGESVSFLTAAQVSKNILFGLAYDYTLTELRNYNSGSVEAFIHYIIGGDDAGAIYENPRFFQSNSSRR